VREVPKEKTVSDMIDEYIDRYQLVMPLEDHVIKCPFCGDQQLHFSVAEDGPERHRRARCGNGCIAFHQHGVTPGLPLVDLWVVDYVNRPGEIQGKGSGWVEADLARAMAERLEWHDELIDGHILAVSRVGDDLGKFLHLAKWFNITKLQGGGYEVKEIERRV